MVLSMERWVGRVAIVTGASAGCGAAIAERLVKEGIIVVGFARRVEKIQELSETLKNEKGKLHALKVDMTVENDILEAFKWVEENLGPVHILINNAGISLPTTLSNGDTTMWKKVLDTNVLGLCIATREAVQIMKKHDIAGQIIHINSILGHYVAHVPNVNMYSASKFAVTALTESLRQEFLAEKSKIRVCSVSPGPVDTEFIKGNDLNKDESFIELFESMPKLTADDVADGVLYVLSTPPHVQVQDILMRPLGEPV